jgi:glycosyltransferase involved in cell wall biosynthesis
MRVLYLSPLLPAPNVNGGKQAIFNHLKDILRSNIQIDLIAIDVDHTPMCLPNDASSSFRSIRVFDRKLPVASGFIGLLYALRQLVLDQEPRAVAVVNSNPARLFIQKALLQTKYDLIVIDHLNAAGLLSGISTDIPIQYISHNIESDVLHDQFMSCRKFTSEWFRLWLEVRKMKKFEHKLVARATIIRPITPIDAEAPLFEGSSNKVKIWPELPNPKGERWRRQAPMKLLFVGSLHYFPNKDAILWLVEEFMPQLSAILPEAVLHIAGTSLEELPNLSVPQNVVFEGFVSRDRLDELHHISTAFVCPVILGSGVKIKVLEASSYGLPIAATSESLRGIEFLKGVAVEISRNPIEAALALKALIENQDKLEAVSTKILQGLNESLAQRDPLIHEI